MVEMGNYCKAHHVSCFRKFARWKETTNDLRGETKYVDGKELLEPRTSLEGHDILYLQENYVVTDGIFKDEHIIYEEITDDWKEFCSKELGFEIPDYAQAEDENLAPSVEEPAASAADVEVAAGEERDTN